MSYEEKRRSPTPPTPTRGVIAALMTGTFAVVCVLKLAGAVSWPSTAILAPIWLPWACVIVFVGVALLWAALS